MSYKPLVGKDDFDEVFKYSCQNVSSENFKALILITNETFGLGMILPKKNIKLAVQRNYLKRIIRNLSIDVFAETKISLIVISKKRILDFKKDKLRREIKTLFLNLTKKLNEKIIIYLIKFYQITLSPLLGSNCRFQPTCSQYMIEAINLHGVLKGLSLGLKEFLSVILWGPKDMIRFLEKKSNGKFSKIFSNSLCVHYELFPNY